MNWIDWIILLGTLLFIVIYGAVKSTRNRNLKDYFLGDQSLKWWQIGISVMATQASAITFISTPGQAYEDGMGFVQFYFGLPLAMIVISVFIIPQFYKLNVFTAYEYLENRFDVKVRQGTAMLFLIQRGLAAGITIYAPSIILSSILGWDLNTTNIFIGSLVIIYTVSGGSKAVSITQQQQMAVMMGGMIIAVGLLIYQISKEVTVSDAIVAAGKTGKMNFINWNFDLNNRYTIWTGILGGFFLSLSYFGTDQSQVGRYLGGKSMSEIRVGLLMNGMLKIPMQLLILFSGVLVFIFFNLVQPPSFFNQPAYEKVKQNKQASIALDSLNILHEKVYHEKKNAFIQLSQQPNDKNTLATYSALEEKDQHIRNSIKQVVTKFQPDATTKDADYVFISYIQHYMPVGIIGILFAVIFSAAMSSTSSELNALASTTLIDFYKRSFKKEASDKHYVFMSKFFTALWGLIAIVFASIFSLFDNLIEAVNIIGSLFYGTILGIFLVGFFTKKINANVVFISAMIAQTTVLIFHFLTVKGYINIAYLWYNVIGCFIVILISWILQFSRLKLPIEKE